MPDPPDQTPLWTLDAVTLRGSGRARLDGVSLEIQPGVTAVIGYSGAGKTSLLNLLVGFERPSSGTVWANLPRDGLALFWVPDNDGLWPHLTVAEHVQVVGGARTMPSDGASAGGEVLDAFDLADLACDRPDRLSRGERSRLSVARAVASGAAVLVMDEPLAHVDPARVGRYWDVLRGHCRAHRVSLVLATHEPGTVLAEAQRVVCLNDGRLCYAGAVRTLYNDPPSAELAAFLGPANWFEPGESGRWLGGADGHRRCYRPERLRIAAVEAGRLIVRAVRFHGSYAEVEVHHETNGGTRRLFHRPAGDRLKPGDRVSVAVIEE